MDNKIEQVKKFELNYPEHHHPHGVEDTEPNDSRIWVCTECPHIFTDAEIRDSEANGWAHDCKMHPCRKGQRCESHLEPYLPAPALYSEPQVCPKPEQMMICEKAQYCTYGLCPHKFNHLPDSYCLLSHCSEFPEDVECKPIPACIPVPSTPAKPKIVCLCGSTRFGQAFQEANLRETLAGNIVLSIGCNMRDDDVFKNYTEQYKIDTKQMLDELHKRKIDLADEVLILNVGDYIGESTKGELEYAKQHGKTIRFLEPHSCQ